MSHPTLTPAIHSDPGDNRKFEGSGEAWTETILCTYIRLIHEMMVIAQCGPMSTDSEQRSEIETRV